MVVSRQVKTRNINMRVSDTSRTIRAGLSHLSLSSPSRRAEFDARSGGEVAVDAPLLTPGAMANKNDIAATELLHVKDIYGVVPGQVSYADARTLVRRPFLNWPA